MLDQLDGLRDAIAAYAADCAPARDAAPDAEACADAPECADVASALAAVRESGELMAWAGCRAGSADVCACSGQMVDKLLEIGQKRCGGWGIFVCF